MDYLTTKTKTAAIICFFTVMHCFAGLKHSIFIKGKVNIDVNKSRGKQPNDSIINFCVSKYPFGSIEQELAGRELYQVKYDQNDSFEIDIPSYSEVVYLQIYTNKTIDVLGAMDYIFMVNAGDSLICTIDNLGITFFGKGKDRMNCQAEILRNRYKASEEERLLHHAEDYDAFLKKQDENSNISLQKQLDVIQSYSDRLDDGLLNVLIANSYGLKLRLIVELCNNMKIGSQKMRDAIKRYYSSYSPVPVPAYISDLDKTTAPLYTNYLFQTVILQNLMQYRNTVNWTSKEFLGFVYNDLIKLDNGIIKDKLFSLYYLTYLRNENAEEYINSSLNMVEHDFYRELLSEIYAINAAGAKFFDFALPDSNGKTVRLSDFRNKVVYIHFWYTGCFPCAKLSSAMPYILDCYKDNPNVAFVTISIDKNREGWLKSLSRGTYTHNGEINLFTDGEGLNHPLIRHYGILFYPASFLISDGKIVSAALPIPNMLENGEPDESSLRLIAIINRALNQNKKT